MNKKRQKQWWYSLLLLFIISNLNAQFSGAFIKNISDVSREKPIKISSEADKIKIFRGSNNTIYQGVINFKLLPQDSIIISGYTRVEIFVQNEYQKGRLILGENAGSSYNIVEDPSNKNHAEVRFKKGQVTVDWEYGILTVIIKAIKSRLRGTKVLFFADSTKNETYIFLKEGSITFPDFPEIFMGPMDKFGIEPNLPPKRIELSNIETAKLQRIIKTNETLWPRWYQTPYAIYGGGAAITIIGGAIIYKLFDGDGDEKDLPFPELPPHP